jgi:hypothetical protein
MPPETRRIGLSLGADICWPMCYEELMKRLDLTLDLDGRKVRFEVERVSIEPYSLRQPCRYDLVVDRLTHWYHVSREWIKKSIVMDDLYVFNNPWSIQSNEKHTSYAAMMALGFPIPETWMVPPKEYEPKADLEPTLHRYAKLFDLGDVGRQVGYPHFMKPYDGGGWVGVSKIQNEEMLRAAYELSGRHIMHLQRAVDPYDAFVRVIGFGPQLYFVKYDPSQPLHDRYTLEENFLAPGDREFLADMTLTINAFFGWDFNSCEALRQDGKWFPIDFANACPDSQVTSLHYHFPWLVIANLKWSLFVAATKRKMRRNLDWEPFYEISRTDRPFREKLALYARVARERFDVERFEEFCDRHIPHLEEAAWEFFATDTAREAVRQKTAALYPPHEVEPFTELFFARIQQWREKNFGRIQEETAAAGARNAARRAAELEAAEVARRQALVAGARPNLPIDLRPKGAAATPATAGAKSPTGPAPKPVSASPGAATAAAARPAAAAKPAPAAKPVARKVSAKKSPAAKGRKPS